MPELQQVLSRVRRALKPGARFAALVWSTEDKNPYIGLQLKLVREMGRMPSPPPSLTRTVSLSEPGKLAQAFGAAGFTDVRLVGPNETAIPDWDAFHLDTLPDGSIAKPDSLFMEGLRTEERRQQGEKDQE